MSNGQQQLQADVQLCQDTGYMLGMVSKVIFGGSSFRRKHLVLETTYLHIKAGEGVSTNACHGGVCQQQPRFCACAAADFGFPWPGSVSILHVLGDALCIAYCVAQVACLLSRCSVAFRFIPPRLLASCG